MQPVLIAEALESRRLMAYSSVDYFPLVAGATANYTATYNSHTATVKRTMTGVVVGSTHAVRVDDKVSVSGQVATLSRSYANDTTKGLRLLNQINAGASTVGGTVNFASPLPVLPGTFGTGTVDGFSKLAYTGTINGGNLGNVSGSGTDTGHTTVAAVSRLDQNGWVFLNVAGKIGRRVSKRGR